jgi:hypothetical protein
MFGSQSLARDYAGIIRLIEEGERCKPLDTAGSPSAKPAEINSRRGDINDC